MHFFLLGICGSLMSALALILRRQGHQVTGCDQAALPPASDMLAQEGIDCRLGYEAANLPAADCYVIGNSVSRGNPMAERILREKLPFASAAQTVERHLLRDRLVIAVAGTHGKSTITALTAAMLDEAGMDPGWLIGALPMDGQPPARTGSGPVVIEADEYDTAFFDKSAKFLHYHPDILLINNLEFDHADIYSDIADIRRQFHRLLRTMPDSALILAPAGDDSVGELLTMGCWSQVQYFGNADADWSLQSTRKDSLRVHRRGEFLAEVAGWQLPGEHNRHNLLAAFALAVSAGAEPAAVARAAGRFQGIRRRFELIYRGGGIRLYDDFAHHPTAITANLKAMKAQMPTDSRLLAAIDLASNSMAGGHHLRALTPVPELADLVFWHGGSAGRVAESAGGAAFADTEKLQQRLLAEMRPGDWLILCSNGYFGDLRHKLPAALKSRG